MAFEDYITAGKDEDLQGIISNAGGSALTLTAGSDVLLKIGRGYPITTPDLDLNGTALSGGSVTSFSTASSGPTQGQYTVKLFGADTATLNPGTYDCDLLLVDAGDGNRVKFVDRGVIHVGGTTSGKST